MRVLNVGGGSRDLPERYAGWQQDLLDIDPANKPDILCDVRRLPPDFVERSVGSYDAIYCSHVIEHLYQHELTAVLKSFIPLLTSDGVVEIFAPNLTHAMKSMLSANLDLNDVWYRTEAGLPVTFHDVFYGWSAAMQQGNLYFAHKCGFTALSLGVLLQSAGYARVVVTEEASNLHARANK
jgi:hypothetical protein